MEEIVGSYRVIKEGENDPWGCNACCLSQNDKLCGNHEELLGLPNCCDNDCHFELVTETNQKE